MLYLGKFKPTECSNTFILKFWRRKSQPILVVLPGEHFGQWSLVVCCPWGRTGLYTTEAT